MSLTREQRGLLGVTCFVIVAFVVIFGGVFLLIATSAANADEERRCAHRHGLWLDREDVCITKDAVINVDN